MCNMMGDSMKGKRTALYEEHKRLGAKMVNFAGYIMPLWYEDINKEHLNVRENVGIFDVSHMGEIVISGPQASEAVDFLVTNKVAKVKPGRAVYSPACYSNGGIVDDMIVYKIDHDHYFICVNASNKAKDFEHFQKALSGFDCKIEDRSDEYSQIAVQGPKSEALMAVFFGDWVKDMRPFRHKYAELYGEEVLVATTGYTGERGFEVYMPNNIAPEFFRALLDKGADLGVKPIGLGARDTLRMEMKYCLYGNDIDESTTPLEAGLEWTVKFDKPDFMGKEALLKQKEEGITRHLVQFVVEGKGFPRHGARCLDEDREIGHVTSSAFSPVINKVFGLAYVKTGYEAVGTAFEIDVHGRYRTRAVVVEPPVHKTYK